MGFLRYFKFWLKIIGIIVLFLTLTSSLLANEVGLRKFFQKKKYTLTVDDNREIYRNDQGLVWEFQPFNKLFKVNRYAYFFNKIPNLKNNRIQVNREDFNFLSKVVGYYEKRNKSQKKVSTNTQAKASPSTPKNQIKKLPQKNKLQTENQTKNKTSVSKNTNTIENDTIDDLYTTDKQQKIDYIFIDPGHGGRDPGARFYGYLEKDLVLSLAKELAEILQKEKPDFKVVLTRSNDTYISLEHRCIIANQTLKQNENGIFISIHLNAWIDPNARGIEVYYLTDNEKVIQKKSYRHLEDLANAYQGYFKKVFSYLKVIQYQIESRFLSYQIIKSIGKHTDFSVHRGFKDETFYVLKGVLMPSVLLELGFISNRKDMELLNSKNKRQEILKQIASALMNYTDDFKKSNGFRDNFYFNKFLTLD